jgi:pilus assembly protein FimV
MQTSPPWKALALGSVAAWAVSAAAAAGLGAGAASTVLGQPLDFPVQVRLEPGEGLNPECVAAEVTTGDRRVPPSLVGAIVEMTGTDTARVRVRTQTAIDEPVVSVQLTVGCSSKISRRYVVMADPPLMAMAVAPAFAANPAPVPDAAAAAPAPAPPAAQARPPAEPQTAAAAAPRASVEEPPAAPRPARPARVARSAPREPGSAAPARPRRTQARSPATERRAATPETRSAPAPRLRLDVAEPPPRSAEALAVDEALAAVAEAASAARAAASAASASAERIAVLERTVESLRVEAKTSKDLAAQLRQRLSEAEKGSMWTLPLMVVAGLLAALSAWLAWRLGRAQSVRQEGWRDALVVPPAAPASEQQPSTMAPGGEATPSRLPTAPIPFVTSELRPGPPPASVRVARASPAWPPPAPPVAWPPPDSLPPTVEMEPVPPTQRTEPMPAGARSDEDSPRDVSIEELIDLEQQADFFVVLGQDEAAIDLLVEHVRTTGGGSPLPYLKLLEIHHRRNDREAYERMRGRFNHRFNAYAPEWGVDLTHGRSLDDYAGVLPRLQQVWPRPLDAMAELEALLFRKSRGELFDLPAYREVLFLYSLARDLLDRAAADTGNVDLLLPLADGTEFGSTAPSPFTALERDAFRDTMPPDDRPTAPVDFDVTGIERPTSIFDLLDEKTQPGQKPH